MLQALTLAIFTIQIHKTIKCQIVVQSRDDQEVGVVHEVNRLKTSLTFPRQWLVREVDTPVSDEYWGLPHYLYFS